MKSTNVAYYIMYSRRPLIWFKKITNWNSNLTWWKCINAYGLKSSWSTIQDDIWNYFFSHLQCTACSSELNELMRCVFKRIHSPTCIAMFVEILWSRESSLLRVAALFVFRSINRAGCHRIVRGGEKVVSLFFSSWVVITRDWLHQGSSTVSGVIGLKL